MIITIGTRGSKLAKRQAQTIAEALKQAFPQHEIRLEVITTKGDRNQTTALHQMQDKGLFVKELEERLLDGSIDLAVHSMKDMPSLLPAGLCLGPVPKAEAAEDVLILRDPVMKLTKDFAGVIGTGSKRRSIQLQAMYPHALIKGIRGNIDTRIQKMQDGEYDGIVLAAAGVRRLQYEHLIHTIYPLDTFIPACGQGILAVELREDRKDLIELLDKISDEVASVRARGERTFLRCVDGGCHIPVGAYVKQENERITISAMLGTEDGAVLVKGRRSGAVEEVEALAEELAKELMRKRELHG